MPYSEAGSDWHFDPFEFLLHLKERWPLVAGACGLALLITLTVSLLLPKKYTATAQVLIQPPAGNDPRAATAITPVYLDSLKAYERIASSDLLFSRAVDHIHMTASGSGKSIESLKKGILDVRKVANTAILEISATMKDPRMAQALAQDIAEQTVETTRTMEAQSETETTREYRRQYEAAETRLRAARAARIKPEGSGETQGLQTQLDDNADMKLELERDRARAQSDLAAATAQLQMTLPAESDAVEYLNREVAAAKARISVLEARRSDLIGLLDQEDRQLAARKAREQQLEAEEISAQAAFDLANTRLNEVSTSGAFRSERLKVIDPGIVPQEPGSPNIPLNLIASLIAAVAGSFIWISVSFGYRGHVRARSRAASRETFSYSR